MGHDPANIDQKIGPGDRSTSLRRFSAETLGVALFIFFGHSATAQVLIGAYFKQGHGDRVIRSNNSRIHQTVGGRFEFDYGDHLTVALAHGIGLTLAIASCGAVSGGHLNPAITIAEVVFKRLPATVIPIYITAQCIGAFVGISLVYTVHAGRLDALHKKGVDVSPVYYTSPVFVHTDTATLVWDQALASAFFSIVYLSMDDGNTGIKSKPIRVFIIGAAYTLIKLAVGINAGAAINPVADTIPRVFAYIVGDQTPFNIFMAIPLCIPFFGAVFGGLIYELCIRFEQPEEAHIKVETKIVMESILKLLNELESFSKDYKPPDIMSLPEVPASRRNQFDL